MSKANFLNSCIQAALRQRGGSLTRKARIQTMHSLADLLYELGHQVPDLAHLRGKHMAIYARHRLAQGLNCRTLANDLGHIRGALRQIGRKGMADDPRVTNKALGLEAMSRRGTNHAITSQAVELIVEAARDRPSDLAAIGLQRHLGLRAQEAVMSGKSLAMWETQLMLGQPVHVIRGTKGKRPRYVTPVDRAATLAAVRYAKEVSASHSNGELFPKAKVEQACKAYANNWNRIYTPASKEDATSHSFRYAYAQDRERQCLAAGLSRRDAQAVVALDLGHGCGRGRYVQMVYGMRPAIAAKHMWTAPQPSKPCASGTDAASPIQVQESAPMLIAELPADASVTERYVGDAQVIFIKGTK